MRVGAMQLAGPIEAGKREQSQRFQIGLGKGCRYAASRKPGDIVHACVCM